MVEKTNENSMIERQVGWIHSDGVVQSHKQKFMPPTAPELLGMARQHMEDRAAQYDSPGGERSMGKAIAAFNAITGRTLTEQEGWLLMLMVKQVRLFRKMDKYHADSAEDGIAYAALMSEAFARNA